MLVVLVIAALFFAVRSVRNAPVREGMDTKGGKQSLASKITGIKKFYDDLIKKDAPSKNQKLAALQDAKETLSSAGVFVALNAFSGSGDDTLKDAAALVAMRQLIDQAIEDVKSGGSSGDSSTMFGGGDGKSGDGGGGDGDSGGSLF